MRCACTLLLGLILAGPESAIAMQTDMVGLRVIVVDSVDEANNIRARALEGERFEDLASQYSLDFSRESGGYIGTVSATDLSPAHRTALAGLAPGEISPVTPFGRMYLLVQLLSPIEASWLDASSAGLRAISRGRFAEAQARWEEAVQLAEGFGPADYRLNVSLSTLGGVHRVQGHYDEAEQLYQRALGVTESAVGASHPDTAANLTNLAHMYQEQGRYAEAEDLFEQSQEILVDALGPNHPTVARGFGNLARLRQAQGNYEAAESLYQVALSILEQALGPNDLAVAETLDGLAAVLEQAGRPAEAARMAERVETILAAQPNP